MADRRMSGRTAALAAAALVACAGGGGEGAPADPIVVVDAAGREVRLASPARRVVSLVPSVTETVLALGAGETLVARTRYDRDERLSGLPSLGGGLDPSVERLAALDPDLVVAWDQREDRGLRTRLAALGVPVYAAAVEDTADVFATIDRFGVLLDRPAAAGRLAGALRDSLAAVAADARGPRPGVFYLIAGDPPRTAGSSTFIGQLIEIAGGRSAFPELEDGWPAVSLEAVVARGPEVVLLPVGPGLPGPEALAGQAGWRDVPAVRSGRVVAIDADLVARPGPGIAAAARALQRGLARATGGGG